MASDYEAFCEPEVLLQAMEEYIPTLEDFQHPGLKVLTRRVGNLQNEIQRGLDRNGILILILMPQLKLQPNQSARVVAEPDIIFRITENVLLNKTGRSAFYFACRLAAEFQIFKPPGESGAGCLIPREPGMRELNIVRSLKEEENDDDEYAGWDVFFKTKLTFLPRTITPPTP